MLDFHVFILFVVVGILVYSSLKRLFNFWDNRHMPNGPFFSPFLGPGSSQSTFMRLTTFAKRFGALYSYTSFNQKVVVISDLQYVRGILFNNEDSLSSRPYTVLDVYEGTHSKTLKQGSRNAWFGLDDFRKDFLSSYDFRDSTETETAYLISATHETKNGPLDIEALLRKAATNVISQLVFGRRFEYSEDRVFHLFGRIAFDHAKSSNAVKWIGVNSIMVRVLSKLRNGAKEALTDREELREFVWQMVKKCENSVTIDDCFVREFLKQQDPANYRFTDTQLRDSIMDIFSQIPEPISATLLWAVFLAAKFPEAQEKLFDEAQSAAESMPYTEAFIMETMRYATIRSYSAHMANGEFVLDDWRFPAKSVFLVNYWAINRNNSVYTQPGNFVPERFLTEDGQTKTIPQAAMLGFGARPCIDGKLLIPEIIHIFASLIREFKFGISSEDREKDLNPEEMGWMLYPTPMNLKIATRDDF